MAYKVDHIGIAVRSISDRMDLWKVLGLNLDHIEEVPEQKVKVAMFPIGESKIELLEPTSADSPVAKFIETRGEGIHHVALGVKDITVALDEVRAAGYRLIDQTPRRGAGGALIAFLHPKDAGGNLIELCQRDQGG